VESVVLGHGVGVEGREPAQRVAVGDPLAQFPEIPGLHPPQHERPEHLRGAQALAARPGPLEAAHEILMDEGDEVLVRVEKVGDGLQGRVQRDASGRQLEVGKTERLGARSHRPRCRRWATRNACGIRRRVPRKRPHAGP
jgi:hypothetical protein